MRGPLPSPNPRRRNARPSYRVLPAGGREGRCPRWPLRPASAEVRLLWRQLWHCPQAVVWEEQGSTRVVARYASLVVEAEKTGARAALLAECRALEDRLGLSPMAMERLRWSLGDRESAGEPPTPSSVGHIDDMRRRLEERSELYGGPGDA